MEAYCLYPLTECMSNSSAEAPDYCKSKKQRFRSASSKTGVSDCFSFPYFRVWANPFSICSTTAAGCTDALIGNRLLILIRNHVLSQGHTFPHLRHHHHPMAHNRCKLFTCLSNMTHMNRHYYQTNSSVSLKLYFSLIL